jgi:Fe-Mn family superoxide dismutase
MKPFELISLPYAPEDLEPVISRETIALHHGKHLQTYVTNLNNLLPGSGMEELALEEIVKRSEGGIFNNAGQILNHNLYFLALSKPKADNAPTGVLADAIKRQFGSIEAFQKEFTQKGVTLFGSGWVWLSKDNEGQLVITQEQNAQNPVTKGLTPLLTFDVWEHAYYVDYQNRRADHLAAMWQIVDWDVVGKRYEG